MLNLDEMVWFGKNFTAIDDAVCRDRAVVMVTNAAAQIVDEWETLHQEDSPEQPTFLWVRVSNLTATAWWVCSHDPQQIEAEAKALREG